MRGRGSPRAEGDREDRRRHRRQGKAQCLRPGRGKGPGWGREGLGDCHQERALGLQVTGVEGHLPGVLLTDCSFNH